MSNSLVNKTAARRLGQVALLAAALITTVRIAQLAEEPSSTPQNTSAADAELAQLYSVCPMAAVVDLHTVATNPAQVDALLPPYRATADRVPNTAIDPDIPRIHYPVAVRAPAPTGGAANNLRLAQLPQHDATETANPDTSTAESGSAADDWLINPTEWFTPEEQQRRATPHAESSDTAPTAPPRATAQPPAGPSPTGGDWKLLTPEDLSPAAPPTSATPNSVDANSQLDTPTPEPAPPQSSDAIDKTTKPSQESQPPTVDALPPDDKPGAPVNDQSGTELFSAPDLDLPATTDAVGSDPAAAVPETETPAVDAPVADTSENNSSVGGFNDNRVSRNNAGH